MRTRIKEVVGVDWFDGAVMNCTWEGPLIRDVLLRAGVVDSEVVHDGVSPRHVHFANYGGKTQHDEWYGGSIPFARVMDPDMEVILALKVRDKSSEMPRLVPLLARSRLTNWHR